jgi:hypothetical protein
MMDSNKQLAFDTTMAAIGSKATYGGASTSVVSWLLSSEFGILMGILIGVTGLVINWYYRYKDDRRKEEEHKLRISKYE